MAIAIFRRALAFLSPGYLKRRVYTKVYTDPRRIDGRSEKDDGP